MTVKELMAELLKSNPDAKVHLYYSNPKGDILTGDCKRVDKSFQSEGSVFLDFEDRLED
ncbi:hypothetical protein [Paraglaciecola chathamensis]|uniref:hypothetical protein n=1 Tax=Paraglaciecola chathamensis TaxID=368405 RepID=UPI003627658E